MMTAAAQPTPARTVSAPAAQFRAQAPHSMQRLATSSPPAGATRPVDTRRIAEAK